MQQHLHVRLVWKPFSLREIPGGLDARSLAADQRAHSAVVFFFEGPRRLIDSKTEGASINFY